MNNEKITDILTPLIESKNANLQSEILGATTNLQLACANDLCFYNLNSEGLPVDTLKKRLTQSDCKNLVTTLRIEIPGINIWVVSKEDFLKAQKIIADILYPDQQKLKLIGITGTNGKTSTSYLAMQIASNCNYPSLSIGTIGIRSSEKVLEKDLLSTTPSYLELRKIIHKYQKDYKFLFIEVSSHALAQKRLFDIELELGAWTSFSQDHLDYHSSFEEYFKAKCLLVNNLKNKNIIVPQTEEDLIKKLDVEKINTYIVKPFYDQRLSVGFKAKYNQNNLAIARALVQELIGRRILMSEMEKINLPDGRFEPVEINGNIIIVDYAHTPDALENICNTIKSDFNDYELVVVFGCGGDRDTSKRSLMGKVVEKYADSIIVTSDNPRTEEPMKIIEDIVCDLKGNYTIEEDRKKAIELAINNLKKRSVVLVAGKGHEDYQEIKGVKYHFSDSEVIRNAIKGL
ncbi:UDP-N-acetylmuramoyl-L-alanyl-D-glutamate--2,6-diaminopimelate ligase [Halobacteriovorax sp. HLS]|uniref:UDP-N-acetylmuramoyl-L-alanyl-D-glutamate--2, 6-diaminopimelate ligase n=1 Tax=Halobacteriovorax sp. HLS TaxID=2234000 RepID=UPI000FD7CA22|nr:UDP-N-acetylmuramoyl-L-alanyl-D-glutamate--2,6-diaminopimelate ligase [Halobacteriovorax sp. HLS]